MKKPLLIFFLIVAAVEVSAQWDWQLVDSMYVPLPASVHVYQTGTPTEGKPNKAFYVRLPLHDRHLIFHHRLEMASDIPPPNTMRKTSSR